MVVAATVGLAAQATAQPFLDCHAELQPLLSAQSALEKVSEINKAGQFRFSSDCLEILMRKNFFEAADYLLEEYYPKTRIDTEIIVKKVERDVERRQNYLLYTLLENRHRVEQKEIQAGLSEEDKKTWKPETWPRVVEPMLQYAQSRDAIYVRVRMHEDVDAPECAHSFSKHIDVGSDYLQLSVVCFESETDIRKFEKKVNFSGELNTDDYEMSEEGDAILILKLPKQGGEVYWPEVLREESRQSENNIVWKKLNDHYFEEVQDLKERMSKDQAKTASKKTDDSVESEKPATKASSASDEEDVVEVDL